MTTEMEKSTPLSPAKAPRRNDTPSRPWSPVNNAFYNSCVSDDDDDDEPDTNIQGRDKEEPQPDTERHDDQGQQDDLQAVADLEDQEQQAEAIPKPEDDPRENGIQEQDIADPEVEDPHAEEVPQPEGDSQGGDNNKEEGNDKPKPLGGSDSSP